MVIRKSDLKYINTKKGKKLVAFWSPDKNDTLRNNFFRCNELKLFKTDPRLKNVKGYYYCRLKEKVQLKKKVNPNVLRQAKKKQVNNSNQQRVVESLKSNTKPDLPSTSTSWNETGNIPEGETDCTDSPFVDWKEMYWEQVKKNE